MKNIEVSTFHNFDESKFNILSNQQVDIFNYFRIRNIEKQKRMPFYFPLCDQQLQIDMDGIFSYTYLYIIKYLNVNKLNISSNITDILKTKLKLLAYVTKKDEYNANHIILSFFHLIK